MSRRTRIGPGPSATCRYTYDDNGALTADPARGYAYDGFGRLTSISGTTAATYSLDGAGNRVAQTVAGVTTSFDLDVSLADPTILADGTRKYLPGDPSAGHDLGGTWYSALADQAGSAHSTVSEAGTQSAITRYDPFGAARPGSTIPAGIGYAGEWADATGLVNLRARAYDPAAGRFTSRDGFAGLAPSPQTANRYSYALNGPYRYSDPSGRFVNAIYHNGPMLMSMAIQMTPVIGDAYSVLTGVIGFDPIAGVSLSSEERGLAIASAVVIGGGFHLLSRLGTDVASGAKLGKAGDVSVGARVGDGPRQALIEHPFSSGASRLTTSANLARHAGSPSLGGAKGVFVSPSDEISNLLQRSSTRGDLEVALGLEPRALQEGSLIRIDVSNPLDRGLQLPDPSMGNRFHRSGTGLTIGNITEATMDSPLRGDPLVTITELSGWVR